MKIPLERNDKIAEIISVLFLFAGILIVAFALPELPDTVPVHFNLKGEPNRYGSKYQLWIGVGVSLLLYIIFSVVSAYPHLYNYPSQKNDIDAQYKLGSKMTRSLKTWILLFLVILNYIIVQSAYSNSAKNAIWLIGFVIAIVAGHLIYFFNKWKKIK
ncbi:MAG TPA: DUF1648 domain-containing protein [Bacteroidia bacterium]|jgi:uncharacterized membrane protein|nr:DUF1648 domain-containing protein [Bacteroidia bacterium]